MTEEKGVFRGGCLCGAVRYEARERIDAGYCHCRMCQRSSGAPLLAWIAFPTAHFSWEVGKPSTYESSENGRRDFCSRCGTQLGFRDVRSPERIDLNVGSLDDPAAATPEYHIWVGSRIPWLEISDDLPRYADEGPDALE